MVEFVKLFWNTGNLLSTHKYVCNYLYTPICNTYITILKYCFQEQKFVKFNKTVMQNLKRKHSNIAVSDSCAEIIVPNATVVYYRDPLPNGRYADRYPGILADIYCNAGYKRYGPWEISCSGGAWSQPISIVRCVPSDQGEFN